MSELIPFFEGSMQSMRELERQLIDQNIEVEVASPPKKACCGGSCGCGMKLQLLVRKEDAPRIQSMLQAEWLAAVQDQTGALVQLGTPAETAEGAEPPCPACGFVGPLNNDGECGDCGLKLE